MSTSARRDPDSARAPVVSVIVPMYQSGWCVEEALDSILAQSLTDFEAIIINDGSTDDGTSIARRFADTDHRFRIIDQTNQGLAAARNSGLDAARGEFIYFLDADDRLMPWGLEALVRAAREYENAGVHARTEWRDVAGKPTNWAPMTDHPEIGLAQLLQGCPFPVHAALTRRGAVGDTRFDPTLRIGEDWDFWLRLAERGVRWKSCDRVVAAYRMSPGSLSRDPRAMWSSLRATIESAHARANSDPRGVIDELALEWATAAAATGDIDAGLGLLREAGVRRVSPHRAAAKVFHRLAWMLGFPPSKWASAPTEALGTSRSWSSALERHQLGEPGFTDAVMSELAALAATPEMVAASIADACAGGPVTLIGLGRNARPLAFELQRRGATFDGWDDGLMSTPRWAADLGINIAMSPVPPAAPREGGREIILTMSDDAAAMARWGGCVTQRWSSHRRQIAETIARRFEAVVSSPADNQGGLAEFALSAKPTPSQSR